MNRKLHLSLVLFYCIIIAIQAVKGDFWRVLLLLFLVYIATGGWDSVKISLITFPRDARSLIRLIKTKVWLHRLRRKNLTIPQLFMETVKKHPDRVAILYEDVKWTFTQLDEYSNKVANCFVAMNFHPGQEVALFMESRPEFIGIWLGLAKAGLVTSLINTNLRRNTLVHSISVVNCKAVIFSSDLADAIKEISSPLSKAKEGMKYFCLENCDLSTIPAQSLNTMLEDSPSSLPPTIWRGNFTDRLFYIYTSGTTGLPKAAIIKHSRFCWMGAALRNLIGFRPHETIYTCLPLYHLSGGCLAVCQCLIFGDTLAIRQKFSASKFWDDCIKFQCTAAQYIGEICRYLLAQPNKPTDSQHQVSLMFGNGLRPKIWKQFTDRFNIKQVGEFYGSTEGNANVINVDNKEGSCGFISRIIPAVYPVALIKIDEQTNEPVRDEDGLCVPCQGGECGEFVGKIIETDPSRAFDGYVDSEASKKKVVHDVFHKGDKVFRSGDLLYMDKLGYLYFKDRTGDTFRWKGENVSTLEVEAIISNVLGLVDCVVYGVEIPGCEGKAGMVAILDPENRVDLNELLIELRKVLPSYSVPTFVRKCRNLDKTATFKLPKTALLSESFNPSLVTDPIYYYNIRSREYLKLDHEVYERIQSQQIVF